MNTKFYSNFKIKDGKSRKVLIAAGGSGGHIFPAIALARKIREKSSDTEVLFVGGGKTLDRKIFEAESFSYYLLSANKLPYKLALGTFVFLLKLFADLIRSILIIISSKPDAVVGFGGYVSWPVVFAAWMFRIKCMIHEQNVVPGRANKMLFSMVDRICITFDETKKYLGRNTKKAVVTGNPIRASIHEGDKVAAIKKLGLETGRFTILIMGGSQGSHAMNGVVINAFISLGAESKNLLQVVHITGSKDYEWALKEYELSGVKGRVFSFIDNIEDAYRASDIIVTRAGSSAIFEGALFAKPMILIPYPFAGAHQSDNAAVFSKNGAALVLDEKYITAEEFKRELLNMIPDKERLNTMARSARALCVPEAADNLTRETLGLIARN